MAQHTCREQRTAPGVGAHLRQGLSACCSCSGTIGLRVCELLRILPFPPPSTVVLGSQTHEPGFTQIWEFKHRSSPCYTMPTEPSPQSPFNF